MFIELCKRFSLLFCRYAETLEGHLRGVALRHMPPNLQTLDPKQTGIV
jgi:hypothetical protein